MDRADIEAALAIVKRHILATADLNAYRVAAALDDWLTSDNGTPGTQPREDLWVDTATAAQLLGCSDRWARDIAPRLGGVKHGGRWWIKRDALPE